MYPFGYGLTYTTFAYENYKVSLKDDRLLQISLDVRNTGDTASDEVVQIYGSALESCVKKPICQLLDFVRVKNIAPGETSHIALEIPVEELRFFHRNLYSGRKKGSTRSECIYRGRPLR